MEVRCEQEDASVLYLGAFRHGGLRVIGTGTTANNARFGNAHHYRTEADKHAHSYADTI